MIGPENRVTFISQVCAKQKPITTWSLEFSPQKPGSDFRTWCHMRVELVDDFLACSESYSTVPPVLLSLQNLNSKFQFDLELCDEYLPCAYPPLKAIEVV